jgi:hypothetical protein
MRAAEVNGANRTICRATLPRMLQTPPPPACQRAQLKGKGWSPDADSIRYFETTARVVPHHPVQKYAPKCYAGLVSTFSALPPCGGWCGGVLAHVGRLNPNSMIANNRRRLQRR